MRKLLVMFMAIMMLCSTVAMAEGVDFSAMSDDELRELRSAIDVELSNRQAAATMESGIIAEGDVGEYHVVIVSVAMSKDYKDNPAIVVNYLFTNNSDEADSFMLSVTDTVFQGGIELETGLSVDGHDSGAALLDIKPGATIEVTAAYLLRDTTSPVEIEVGKLIDFSDNPAKIIATVALPE